MNFASSGANKGQLPVILLLYARGFVRQIVPASNSPRFAWHDFIDPCSSIPPVKGWDAAARVR